MPEITTQRMISAHAAEQLKNIFLAPVDRDNVRPVLWPTSRIEDLWELLEAGKLEYSETCQRNLVHMVCNEDFIRVLLVRPRTGSDWYLLGVDDLVIPYDFTLQKPDAQKIYIICRLLMGKPHCIEACFREPGNEQLFKSNAINVYTPDRFKDMTKDEHSALAMARVLEYYAFSPYTTYKERPTFKQAMNPSPATRKWSAIEIVNLRIPKRRPDAEPGTGKRLDHRVEVIEHLRRQPTREGIKLITIASHLRGPKDAPVRPKRQKVYKVVK